eukprot:TRINITY_DN12998_c0_g1_i1.p1 TRINITY_DN12998_c0_g1~~TRINITY_DN12998_c0_g1_i1.p1  ORF type:complete len:109 (-),score=7.94 TRINITY_DN12998_c0_g1_i1:340-666(-)
MVQWQELEVAWLKQHIEAATTAGKKCIVLSHHAPTHNIPWGGDGFSSDLEYLFADYGKLGNSTVQLWAYGHTHYNKDMWCHNTRVISNQAGYPHELSDAYNPACALSL